MPFRGLVVSDDADRVEIRRFDGVHPAPSYATPEWCEAHRADLRAGVALDTETTGLDVRSDRVIEVAMLPFVFDRTNGDVVSVGEPYAALQDPGFPLSPEVTRITGLTDDDLRGQRIDLSRVRALLKGATVVVAHNAGFDRPFVEALIAGGPAGAAGEPMWGCSLQQIDWSAKGMPSAGLEVLCVFHGFFIRNHRAGPDTSALLHLLAMHDADTGRAYLDELLRAMRTRTGRVRAVGAPFETKDALKQRRYRWDGARRVWQKEIAKDDWPAEQAWLTQEVYRGRCPAEFEELRWQDRFRAPAAG